MDPLNLDEISAFADKIADQLKDGTLTQTDAPEMLSEFMKILPLASYFSSLLEFNAPSKDMDTRSAMFGFCLGINAAIFFPEWAQAFQQQLEKEGVTSPENEQSLKEAIFRRYIKLCPLSVEVEPPNAN